MRRKLTLLNTLVSGLILLLFGITGYHYLNSVGLRSIDSDIRVFAHRELRHPNEERHWNRVENQPSPAHLRLMEQLDFYVKGINQDFEYRSTDWPELLDPDSIAAPTALANAPDPIRHHPPRRGRRPRRPRHEDDRPGPPPEDANPMGDNGPPDHPPPFVDDEPMPPLPASTPETRTIDEVPYRVIAFCSPHAVLITAFDQTEHSQQMQHIRFILMVSMPIALILIGLGSWFTSGRAVRSIHLLTETTRDISANGLNHRVPSHDTDRELTQLVNVYNSMLDRLERSFNQAVRFSGDAAHELRTPVTILHGQLEQMVHTLPEGSLQQGQVAELLVQVSRLNRIIRNLLMLARMDAGRVVINREAVDLSEMLNELIEDIEMLNDTLIVEKEILPKCVVQADPGLLRLILSNLITNAVKYNIDSGTIRLTLATVADAVQVEIANTGHALKPDDKDAIFRRFYRASNETNSVIEGSGLGLSIAREAAVIHGGDLELISSNTQWTVFRLTLPG